MDHRWSGGHVPFSKIDYHRLLDWVPWAYGFFLLALLPLKWSAQRLGR